MGIRNLNKLLEYYGNAKNLYFSGREELCKACFVTGINDINIIDEIDNTRELNSIKEMISRLEMDNTGLITRNEDLYPEKLKNITDSPVLLYYKGNRSLFDKYKKKDLKNIAIVGARNCTEYGRKTAYELAYNLARNNINIISGMARGIDKAAHLGALDAGGITTAILGSGINVCYPSENRDIYRRIMEKGIVISEYGLDENPLAWHFPMRNRIISGLCDAIIVVEAREKSGSLITAERALEQGKDIYAVPGRINDKLSRGCNNLIKEGAGIVISPEQIMDDLDIVMGVTDGFEKNKNITLEKDLELLYSCVDYFPKNIEQLMCESKMGSVQFLKNIITLQMMNLIDEPTKNVYVRR